MTRMKNSKEEEEWEDDDWKEEAIDVWNAE